MKNLALITAAIIWCLSQLAPAWGAPPPIPIKDAQVDVGVPLWASGPGPPPAGTPKPMIIDITQVTPAGNATVTTPVPVTNLPAYVPPALIPYVPPAVNTPANRLAAYNAWVAANRAAQKAAWEAASLDKANKIAAAINGTLGAGTAAVTTFVNPVTGYTQGRVTITNAQKVAHGKNSNTTGEVGDGVRFMPGAGGGGGTSPYPYKSTMGSPSGASPLAAGFDPIGGPSVVEYGITDSAFPSQDLTATYVTTTGDSVATILQALQASLEGNSLFVADGYLATYDASALTLTLTDTSGNNFHDGADSINWSMDDINLDGELGMTYGTTAPDQADVPEPASLLLLGAGSLAMLVGKRRRAAAA